jgi:DNA polymerase-3 subunit chi
MTDVGFYHLQKYTIEEALPMLLGFTLKAGKRAIVKSDSGDFLVKLSELLWAHDIERWLPHGTEKDGDAEYQPIWLTTKNDNPNGATFIFLIDGPGILDITSFERCFDLFDGNNVRSVDASRKRWKLYKEDGHTLHYWKQNENGKWEESSI